MSDLVPIPERHRGVDLHAQIEFAKTLAGASLLPKAYRNAPANVLLAMQLGEALQVPPIQAITSIHVIEGRPSASADLLASLVRRAGHRLRVVEEQTPEGPRVTATLIRADDPDYEFRAVWDRTKAKAAGLDRRDNWRAYEGQMMRARAISEVCRMGASDALYGVIYTPEELAPVESAGPRVEQVPMASAEQMRRLRETVEAAGLDGATALAVAREVTGRGDLANAAHLTADEADRVAARIAAMTPAAPADAVSVAPAEATSAEAQPVEQQPEAEAAGAPSRSVLRQLAMHFQRLGIEVRDERIFYTELLAERPGLASANDLTPDEAEGVVKVLAHLPHRQALEAHLDALATQETQS